MRGVGLGNSLKELNETHFIPLFIGIALGIALGTLPIALPGLPQPLRLGLAGGALIVALVLGRLGRIGRLVWHMPANVNLAFREFVLQRAASQQIASVDSIHRSIVEGYCRRSLNEYLHFLNIALASAGESLSGLHAFQAAKQIADVAFQRLDAAAFKLENGLKRLIESLQKKKLTGTWDDRFVVRETNVEYRTDGELGE